MELSDFVVLDAQVAATVVDDQAVIVLADAGRINILNPLGTRIWELIDGHTTIASIVKTITAEYDVSLETAEHDTCEFVQVLLDRHAVKLSEVPVMLGDVMAGGQL